MRMRSLFRRIPTVPAPLGLLILLIMAFGVMIPWLGFYWDDWPVILTGRLLGTEGYSTFYKFDRPISAWTYVVTFPLLGSSPLGWHLFTLLLRWLTGVAMWWTLVRVWPARRTELTWAAFLFALHPVFMQQSISVAYSQHWICYLLFFLSLGAMVQANRSESKRAYWLLTALAVAFSLLQLLTMEYYTGLELVRPLLLWILLQEKGIPWRKRVTTTLRGWLPYLLSLVGFVIWRLFFLKFPGGDSNPPILLHRMLTDPIGGGLRLVQIAAQDVVYLLVNVWANILSSKTIVLDDRFVLFSWALGLLAGGAAFLFARARHSVDPDGKARWTRQVFWLGAAALLLGVIPVWATDRQIIVGMYSNRFGLAAMFGAALLIVAMVEGWISRPTQRSLIYSLLIVLAVSSHLRTANDYRWSWELQKRFAWQLAWRAPSIEPGTALFSDGEIFSYVGLYSTSAIVNLTYPPSGQGETLPYWFYSLGREFIYNLPDFLVGMPLNTEFRNYTFTGNTLEGVALHFDSQAPLCLQVLPASEERNPVLPDITRDIQRVTNLSRISPVDASPNYPPVEIFGPEPEHSWCYFYQKMSLAAQLNDWEQVLHLAGEAREHGNTPESDGADAPSEWLPLVKAYANLGHWQEARQLSLEMVNRQPPLDALMCTLWDDLSELPHTADQDAAVHDVKDVSGCP